MSTHSRDCTTPRLTDTTPRLASEMLAASSDDTRRFGSGVSGLDELLGGVLDYTMTLWDEFSPSLRENLNRLCVQSDWAFSQSVSCLEWRLSIDDPSLRNDLLIVPIVFQHPHRLIRELGHQGTALLQAYYAFTRHCADFLSQCG